MLRLLSGTLPKLVISPSYLGASDWASQENTSHVCHARGTAIQQMSWKGLPLPHTPLWTLVMPSHWCFPSTLMLPLPTVVLMTPGVGAISLLLLNSYVSSTCCAFSPLARTSNKGHCVWSF